MKYTFKILWSNTMQQLGEYCSYDSFLKNLQVQALDHPNTRETVTKTETNLKSLKVMLHGRNGYLPYQCQ